MKEDKIYQKLISKMEEVSLVKPQALGPLTVPYRLIVPYLKVHPWIAFSLAAFFFTFLVYLLFGFYIVYLVSILQHGF